MVFKFAQGGVSMLNIYTGSLKKALLTLYPHVDPLIDISNAKQRLMSCGNAIRVNIA